MCLKGLLNTIRKLVSVGPVFSAVSVRFFQTTKFILLSIFTITPEYAGHSQGTAYGLHSYSSAFSWIFQLNADSASQSDFWFFPDPLAGENLLNEVASLFTTISYYCLSKTLLGPCSLQELKELCSEKVNSMNFFWFCYSPNPCHPSLSKKQNVLPAWNK